LPLHILTDKINFPPAEDALEDGLLAMGGDLSQQRLLLAYKNGIFPWFEGDVPLWWCPDLRFVLFPDELKVSKSMKQLLKKNILKFTVDKAFEDVIHHCKSTMRGGEYGTWITDEVENAFIKLHHAGFAHSAETWMNNELIGGLYGIRLGKIFFGESMFSLKSNASKFAFINYVQHLQKENIALIDCQVYTEHLESLGAKMIERNKFILLLNEFIT
jgi:leucyl/phenylalanyl-tRNA---protein transferase